MEDNVHIVGMMFKAKADSALSITYADEGSRDVCG